MRQRWGNEGRVGGGAEGGEANVYNESSLLFIFESTEMSLSLVDDALRNAAPRSHRLSGGGAAAKHADTLLGNISSNLSLSAISALTCVSLVIFVIQPPQVCSVAKEDGKCGTKWSYILIIAALAAASTTALAVALK